MSINKITINSEHLLLHLSSLIIQLSQIYSIEYKENIVDSKNRVRKLLLEEHHKLLTDSTKKLISDTKDKLRTKIKNKTINNIERDLILILGELNL